jgi:hypothetical protein
MPPFGRQPEDSSPPSAGIGPLSEPIRPHIGDWWRTGHFRSEGPRQEEGLSDHNHPFISGLSFHSQASQSTTTLPRPVRRRGVFRFSDTVRFQTEAEPSDPIGVSLQNLSFHDATHPRPAQPRRGFSYPFHTHERPSAKSEITVGPITTFVRETPDGGSGDVCGAPGAVSAAIEKLN